MKIFRAVALIALFSAPFVGSVSTSYALLPVTAGTCGMTISTSMQLSNDLICDGVEAFFAVGGPRSITIDLGGHTMSSNFGLAILVQTNGGGVRIRNGRVVGGTFDFGDGSATSFTQYTHIVFDGGVVSGAQNTTQVENGWFVNGAQVSNRDIGGPSQQWDIRGNKFIADAGSTHPAVDLIDGSGQVLGNTISGYDTGVSLSGNTSVRVASNHIFGAGTGISLGGTSDSVITGKVANNRIEYGRSDGIVVADGTSSLVQGNYLKYNAGDGIRVETHGTAAVTATLTFNRAFYNVGFGIDATVTDGGSIVTDGGNNHASGNLGGKCANIAC